MSEEFYLRSQLQIDYGDGETERARESEAQIQRQFLASLEEV